MKNTHTAIRETRSDKIYGVFSHIIILSIMAIGNVLNIGYEKVYLLQNTANLSASEVISTYVYKSGLQQSQYSFASMVGLFNNVVNFIILIAANKLSKWLTETSLW